MNSSRRSFIKRAATLIGVAPVLPTAFALASEVKDKQPQGIKTGDKITISDDCPHLRYGHQNFLVKESIVSKYNPDFAHMGHFKDGKTKQMLFVVPITRNTDGKWIELPKYIHSSIRTGWNCAHLFKKRA